MTDQSNPPQETSLARPTHASPALARLWDAGDGLFDLNQMAKVFCGDQDAILHLAGMEWSEDPQRRYAQMMDFIYSARMSVLPGEEHWKAINLEHEINAEHEPTAIVPRSTSTQLNRQMRRHPIQLLQERGVINRERIWCISEGAAPFKKWSPEAQKTWKEHIAASNLSFSIQLLRCLQEERIFIQTADGYVPFTGENAAASTDGKLYGKNGGPLVEPGNKDDYLNKATLKDLDLEVMRTRLTDFLTSVQDIIPLPATPHEVAERLLAITEPSRSAQSSAAMLPQESRGPLGHATKRSGDLGR